MARFALIAGMLLLAVVYYYVLGYGPTASEIYDDREWWQPRGWIHQWWGLSALSQMARSEGAVRWIPVALFSLPPALAIAAGMRMFQGAVMRSVTVIMGTVLIGLAYYGCLNDRIWRFFEWRWALVITSFVSVAAISAFAPSLLRSLNRAPRAIGASVLLAVNPDPAYAMAQLGHTSPSFTLRVYTHVLRRSEAEREALRALVTGEELAPIGTKPSYLTSTPNGSARQKGPQTA